MARFDIYLCDGVYLLDVQSDLISGLGTRLTVPLVDASPRLVAIRKLHPTFIIDGRPHVMATHLMLAVPERDLGAVIGSLDDHYDQIVAALDMIFLGF